MTEKWSPFKVLGTYAGPKPARIKSYPVAHGGPSWNEPITPPSMQMAAERYRTLQAMAMMKLVELHKEGRWRKPMPQGVIDPATIFSQDELRRAIEEVNRRIT